jgi:hypothetical protein
MTTPSAEDSEGAIPRPPTPAVVVVDGQPRARLTTFQDWGFSVAVRRPFSSLALGLATGETASGAALVLV